MKYPLPILLILAGAVAALAQAPAKPATSAASHATAPSLNIKTPPGLPVVRTPRKTLFVLQYQDIRIGTGPLAEPNKLYTVHYTGWLASNGAKFDSSYDHRMPLKDKDGKPQLDADGKPMLGPPQPLTFPQGFGRFLPGFEQGFNGMRVGGKRRLFIPWELAYGARGRTSPDAAHVVIPPKADLIFDVELLDVKDMPPPTPPGAAPGRGMFGARPGIPVPNRPPAPPATPPAPQPAAPSSAPAPQSTAPVTTSAPPAAAAQQPK